jgi:hypothetical protein
VESIEVREFVEVTDRASWDEVIRLRKSAAKLNEQARALVRRVKATAEYEAWEKSVEPYIGKRLL